MRLNSKKKWKMDRQFHILRGASCRDVASSLVVAVCFNGHYREDEATEWFWNYHCQNQEGICYRHKLTGLINGPKASCA